MNPSPERFPENSISPTGPHLTGWLLGLPLARNTLLPVSQFICLPCAITLPVPPSPEPSPSCPQCGKPAWPHASLPFATPDKAAWQSLCRKLDPDKPPGFFYGSLFEAIQQACAPTTDGSRLPASALKTVDDLARRRHLPNVLLVLGRLWMEQLTAENTGSLQSRLEQIMAGLYFEALLSILATHAEEKAGFSENHLRKIPPPEAAWETLIGSKQNRIKKIQKKAEKAWGKTIRTNSASLTGLDTVWSGRMTEQSQQLRTLRHRQDTGWSCKMTKRRQRLHTLYARLDATRSRYTGPLAKCTEILVNFASLSDYRAPFDAVNARYDALLRRLLTGQIADTLRKIPKQPASVSENMHALLDEVDENTRKIDNAIVDLWNDNRLNPFPMFAARAAERLALNWIASWLPPTDEITDISCFQISKPGDKIWHRADLLQITDNGARQILYDVKNTSVSNQGFSQLSVKHKQAGKTAGINYIGTLTDDWISAWEIKETRIGFSRCTIHVIGIYNEDMRRYIDGFVKTHTPLVTLGQDDLWDMEAKKRQETRVPAYLFAMRQQAWNPFASIPDDLVRTGKFIGLLQGGFLSLATGTRQNTTAFSRHIDSLMSHCLTWRRAPVLPEIYFVVLQGLVEEYNQIVTERVGRPDFSEKSAEFFIGSLTSQISALFFRGNDTQPLCAWDPTRSIRLITKTFTQFISVVITGQFARYMPKITRISVTARGTVTAQLSSDQSITLLCRCEGKFPSKPGNTVSFRQTDNQPGSEDAPPPEKSDEHDITPEPAEDRTSTALCRSWPLIFGNEIPDRNDLPPALSCDVCGRLLCNHGHGCPKWTTNENCRWNQMKKEAAQKARPVTEKPSAPAPQP
ncbi:hypothetical protein [Acetobacter fallax]|uniref:PD-(D/E)XK endonuclease-like domain-containing protein n=1 Tax=Acetobacter fallax TaxID=1737473 RepID=A0ABX0KAY3_9PROT|nr:hypothetical protein [Acetobacter fallax]NHO31665.1 hypothetical protein [Acetobacter fallax]NHO35224.1 hypothetical protein [Acetobacter fallax]